MGSAVDAWAVSATPRVGKLEGLATWLAGAQRSWPVRPLAGRTLLVVAGDHGEGPTSTSAALADLLAGGGVATLAAQMGVGVRVADLAVADDESPEAVRRHKVRRGSGATATAPSLTPAEAEAALRAGVALADAEIDAGADVLVLAELGDGVSAAAAAVVAAVTGAEPVDVVGRGTGDAAWGRTVAAVRDSLRRSQASPLEPLRLLTELAGADMTAMTGVLVAAAARRTPVVLDGLVPTAAAVVAALLAPGAEAYWLAGHRTPDPAHTLALAHLRLEPLLDFGIARGGGIGALLALGILDTAITLTP
jgi:nicotinate-nucleotide--dimethylbenzimidazole phosphoribosyltransferase